MLTYFTTIIFVILYCGTSLAIDEKVPSPSKSLPIKRKHEEYVKTGTRCQSLCGNFGLKCLNEDGDPKPDWYCKSGYARIDWDGECVPIFSRKCFEQWPESPITCSRRPNEVYGGVSFCGDDCSQVGLQCTVIPFIPMYGCSCKEGYARYEGKCIKLSDPRCSIQYIPSPETCKRRPNEIFIADGPTCQETCMWYGVPCEPKQNSTSVSGCYCEPGFIRVYESSDCEPIEIENCQRWIPSPESCRIRNEVYIEGGSPCQTNCATYNQPCTLPLDENLKACYCPEGLARVSERGECIPMYMLQCRTQFP